MDLIVSDVVMPEMTGPEVVEAIVELIGPTPVLFMSGYAKAMQSELALRDGLLTKPFTPAQLLAKVQAKLAALP